MPIEINELNIRIHVNEDKNQVGTQVVNHDQVVAECVEQVLQVLKTKEER